MHQALHNRSARIRRSLRTRPLALLPLLALALAACAADPEPRNRLILLAVDGGALPVLHEGIAAGRLPHFARLVEAGSLGHLASIRSDLPFSPERGNGFWSPVVWNSIATGKPPTMHGVLDFRLPPPEDYQLCSQADAREARVRLPATARARSVAIRRPRGADAPGWRVRLGGGEAQESATDLAGEETILALPDGPTEVELHFEAAPESHEPLCLRELQLLDANGNTAAWLHFVAERPAYLSGWGEVETGSLRAAGTDHRRARAFWNIASDTGRRVAIVGWRDSWPAEQVAGYYVSDRLGLRFASGRDTQGGPHLTYPAALEARLQPLLGRAAEVDARANRTLLEVSPCSLDERNAAVARVSYWGDWLRQQIALDLWEADPGIDLMAVYYRGADAFGHMFQFFRSPRPKRCHVQPPLVDRYYEVLDGFLGAWLERLGDDTQLLIVTDHGMGGDHFKGEHEDNGFFLLGGSGVAAEPGVADAHVLDVAPTVLRLLGLALAEDMPGAPLPGSFALAGDPKQVASYETREPAPRWSPPDPDTEAAVLERLRALGYLD